MAQVDGPLDFDNHKGNGLVLAVADEKNAPTVQVPKHNFFGRVGVVMQAAPDPGIVTSLLLGSPDGDETSFERVGADNTQVQSNWFSKGNTTL